MQPYIKSKCDAIVISGQPLSSKDIIQYTLNNLLSMYHAFKIVIQTNLQLISLDDIYALLCSEELNIATKISKDNSTLQASDHQFTLIVYGWGVVDPIHVVHHVAEIILN